MSLPPDSVALPYRIACVAGARPNFMKIAPVMKALQALGPQVDVKLVHTGQHYDEAMSAQFFAELGIPEPDVNLAAGSGSHAQQTADIMCKFEPVLDALQPHAVLVVGDVNSTLACTLVAVKRGTPVIHVEAGLRSFDRTMPEEINRVLTDQIAALLFTTEPAAQGHLLREGIAAERIHYVGNVMIDTLLGNLPNAAPAEQTVAAAGRPGFTSAPDGYAVVTLHRPANVDDAAVLRGLLDTVAHIAGRTPVVLPLHPRTRAAIERHGLQHLLARQDVLLLPPQGYLEMLGLMRSARVVLTDSGGIQEETTALGVPCITLRDNTERPITVEQGTNTIAGTDAQRILAIYDQLLAGGGKAGRVPHYWDGQAAVRIAQATLSWLQNGRP
ncbi:UDP-N-acetylglucosamine 2-epimerase (non-hydrolyzing) [Pseudoduganella ginsengisoli]|uniref:UDP-N-acetylglucosamine 2-epimerase (Non-hydrolyzing) n=1 Tax=Pseudoduganella ginsengisoli TaxID=1462440 RepID=A0A6L6PYV9_9BURK|nr:UDP-N-acetylglucosamine 2-epimerase (non-hydrolyzing) [Pseudoduganella ginsengisoli]MTW02580.1 UDP-N-acetylglucosamine 2-epimerase (non-hydrolyzing) [Pseudoduganella ginsengisoli]